MSLEQSKKIVEAAGGCWHEHTRGGSAGLCKFGDHYFNSNENPDLFLPETRHLLTQRVQEICRNDHDKWKLYAESLWPLLNLNAGGQAYMAMVAEASVVSSEAIITALGRVILEDTKGGEDGS